MNAIKQREESSYCHPKDIQDESEQLCSFRHPCCYTLWTWQRIVSVLWNTIKMVSTIELGSCHNLSQGTKSVILGNILGWAGSRKPQYHFLYGSAAALFNQPVSFEWVNNNAGTYLHHRRQLVRAPFCAYRDELSKSNKTELTQNRIITVLEKD